ncbi:protein HAIKU1-like [Gastrolobium bilobum]|uniref:protein HAIKU1-like n=1 Tax=Gastrolobium bilobum TaxID=150636 RepID=UPI002AB0A8A3|nr:protein HAIKU1-like [Gastrolobium bilobum]
MDNSKNRHNDSLGVNRMGKNIKKSPLHQPNFGNNAARQQPQPHVYNISKNDFRNIVQQLTGSPSHSQDPPPRPQHNSPKPQSMRLQKIRPPPLTPVNRPRFPPPMPVPAGPPPVPYNNALPRPAQFGQPSPTPLQPLTPGDIWSNTSESPISAYMRYLQNSMMDPGLRGNHVHPQSHPHPQPHAPGNVQHQPPSSALLPNPPMPMFPSPRFNGPVPPMNATNPAVPSIPSPQENGPPLLPSPTSQFLLPSPTGYMNLLSPRSPYPLLSPGIHFPSPLTPNFPFSAMAQSGILGPGPQPPPSPGLVFPLSPSGFFPILSPRWRDH